VRTHPSRRAAALCFALTVCATHLVAQAPGTTNVRNGETAVITTALTEADATAKVRAYFNGRDLDFTVNPETGRIITDWYGEHNCGIGFNKCANRAMVRVVAEDGHTVVRVQVFERKREAGINPKPWSENSTSKGRETSELAAALEAFMTPSAPAPPAAPATPR
jgi:hypothetical protein